MYRQEIHDKICAEEDNRVFHAIDTGHQVSAWTWMDDPKHVSHGVCNRCDQMVYTNDLSECPMRIVDEIHRR
jgi:hypothetical protein